MAGFIYLFGFSGRITRLHWWLGSLALGLLGTIGIIAVVFGLAASLPPGFDPKNTEMAMEWVLGHLWTFLVVLLPLIIGNISLTLRRYHDRGKSGAWVLLGLAPLVFWFAALFSPLWFFIAAPLSMIIPIWQLIELGCLAGTPGSNDHGPDPRDGNRDGLADEIAAMDRYANIDFARYASSPAPQPALGAAASQPVRRGPPAFGKRT